MLAVLPMESLLLSLRQVNMTFPVVPLAVAMADPVLPLKQSASIEIVFTSHCAAMLILENKHITYKEIVQIFFWIINITRGKFIVVRVKYDERSIKGIYDLRQDTFFSKKAQ